MNANRTTSPTGKARIRADRKAAIWIGVLYIIGTVALVLSVVVTDAVLAGAAYLAQVAARPNQLAIGALLVLLAGFALAMVPVVFWPIGRRYNETLAMGYVVFRGGLETAIYVIRLPSLPSLPVRRRDGRPMLRALSRRPEERAEMSDV